MRSLSDADLVDHLNDMCPLAWAELRRRYRGYIRFIASRILSFVDVDDVEQDCFTYLLAKVPDINRTSLKPLVGSAVKYIVWAAIHRAWQDRRAAFVGWNSSVTALQTKAIEEEQLHKPVFDLLSVCTPNERAAVVLHYYQDISASDGALCLGITEKAFHKRLRDARHRMARHSTLQSIADLLPDDYGTQTLWPIVSDDKTSLYFCNKRNRAKRRAALTINFGATV